MNYTPLYTNDREWKYHNSICRDAGNVWQNNQDLTKVEELFFYHMMLEALKERTKIEQIFNF
jgi:hypothetical protein